MNTNILQAITDIRKKKKRPSTEEIFNHLKKVDHNLDIEQFKIKINELEEEGYIEMKGEGKSESYFIIRNNTDDENEFQGNENLQILTNANVDEENITGESRSTAENVLDQKLNAFNVAPNQTVCILYERHILALNSQIDFLKEQIRSQENRHQDEIHLYAKGINRKKSIY